MENETKLKICLGLGIYLFAASVLWLWCIFRMDPIIAALFLGIHVFAFLLPAYAYLAADAGIALFWKKIKNKSAALTVKTIAIISVPFFALALGLLHLYFIMGIVAAAVSLVLIFFGLRKEGKWLKSLLPLMLCTLAVVILSTDMPAKWFEGLRFQNDRERYLQAAQTIQQGELTVKSDYTGTYAQLPDHLASASAGGRVRVLAYEGKMLLVFFIYYGGSTYEAYGLKCKAGNFPVTEIKELSGEDIVIEHIEGNWYRIYS